MITKEDIKQKVRKLCALRGYQDDEETNCMQIIDNYLSLRGSSYAFVDNCLQQSLDYRSWILAWQTIRQETNKLTGDYYIEKDRKEKEHQKLLLDYHPINLGKRFLTQEELNHLSINMGVIDAYGVFHTGKRKNTSVNHRELAQYLKLCNKIKDYYIRVGCVCGQNEDIFCAESLAYGDKNSLQNFLLTEKMAIALYNGIMSRKNHRYSTFEEKLAYYGDEYGYYSLKYPYVNPIYNRELLNKNMNVLTATLGNRFDKKFFLEILKK